jgi:hypothetical protein
VCVNRFDDETKQSFLELYDKVDADFQLPTDNIQQTGILETGILDLTKDDSF